MQDKGLLKLAEEIKILATLKQITIATAESCTGGLLASYLTSIPGASRYFLCGFITYSNHSKISLLDVDDMVLKQSGAVSRETALAMAAGCRSKAGSDVSIAITGIAGPHDGTSSKPTGTVYLGLASEGNNTSHHFVFEGNREEICYQSCKAAMEVMLQFLKI